MDSSTFFGLSTVAYILAMMTYITYLAFRKTTIGIVATAITVTGFISQTLALGMHFTADVALVDETCSSIGHVATH